MRRVLMAAAALVAAVAIFLLATLPPLPATITGTEVDPSVAARTVAGAYHIHTTRSDGADGKAVIAAAAARAGLQFAIFTDHGDATRTPDPPEYLHGVLCLDGVEISTNGGHYVALGLPAAPYPLGGDAAAVVEDVGRLGGFGVAAHPHHPNPELAWSDWSAPIDAIEWINADVEWRNESAVRLARVLFDYLVRPAPALVSVFDRPEATLQQWESLLRRRAVVALAAADAHGSVRASAMQEDGSWFALGPSYEASFRAMSNRVLLDAPFSGNAADDAERLLEGIRRGRVYSMIDAVATGVLLAPRGPEGELRFAGSVPAGVEVREIGPAPRQAMETDHSNAAGSPPVPWMIANPIVRRPETIPALPATPPLGSPLAYRSPWRVEKDQESTAEVSDVPGGFRLTYRLRGGDRVSQFVAAAADIALAAPAAALAFSGRADRPMRVSVQVRFPEMGERWVKSVYLDTQERELVVPIDQMVPAERRNSQRPELSAAGSLLFVVDLTNARPGDSGAFTVTGLRILGQSPEVPK